MSVLRLCRGYLPPLNLHKSITCPSLLCYVMHSSLVEYNTENISQNQNFHSFPQKTYIHVQVQAVLALAASWTSKDVSERSLTGTVIDSGDGVTHVIPVADGYVIVRAIYSPGPRNQRWWFL